MMKLKTKASKVMQPKKRMLMKDRQEENSDEEEEKQSPTTEQKDLILNLCNPGEASYQLLVKLQEMNLALNRIAEAEEKRNQIAEEEYSDEEEEEDDEGNLE